MSGIKVKNLTKVYGRKPKQAINYLDEGKSKAEILELTGMTVGVSKANFEVNPGEIFVIMGLSGSGKSTLVRMLNRLVEPTEGEIYINGKDIAKMNREDLRNVRRKKMSMVFQNFALLPHKTILQNTEFGLEIQGVSQEEREQKAREALELVGLKEYVDMYPDELSGGMQQRVGLARALANDPDILLMDEAFSALDPLIRKDMQDELIDLQASMQKTILFITHDLNEALRLGDRIALMRDGEIVQIGSPEDILVNPANDYVEKFVEDVDRSKILTAQHIMQRPETVNPSRHGPRVALERMREEGISGVYVVDDNRQLKGYVHASDASEAANQDIRSLDGIITNDIQTVDKDMPMSEIFNLIHDAPIPIAVVEDGRLLGVIVRGSVIAALSDEGKMNVEV